MKVLAQIGKKSEQVGLVPTILCAIAWLVLSTFGARAVAFALGDHPRLAYLTALPFAVIGGLGGLVSFWLIADHLDFLRHGYRVRCVKGNEWLYEEDEEGDWDENEPEIEPPARWTPADDKKKEPGEKAADDDDQEQGLKPIGRPGSPSLDGNAVVLHEGFAEEVEWEEEKAERNREQRSEDVRLRETKAGDPFGEVPESCGPFEPKNEPQREEGKEKAEEAKSKTDCAEGLRFFEKLRREGVFGDVFCLLRSDIGLGRRVGRGRSFGVLGGDS